METCLCVRQPANRRIASPRAATSSRRWYWCGLGLALLATGCAGCTRGPSSPSPAQKEKPTQETWDAIYFQGKRIGYAHSSIQRLDTADGPRDQVLYQENLEFQRGGQTIPARTRYQALQTPEGLVLEISYEEQLGETTRRLRGKREDALMRLEVDDEPPRLITWSSQIGGPLAEEQSLKNQPMRPGETREMSVFMPNVGSIISVSLTARQVEPTILLEGEQQLLRIDAAYRLPGGLALHGAMWTAASGEVLKSTLIESDQAGYRTTAEFAKSPLEAGQVDFVLGLLVPVAEPPKDIHSAQRASYLVRLDGGKVADNGVDGGAAGGANPADVFAQSGSQKVTAIDATTARIDVRSIRPGGEPPWADRSPAQGDLESSEMIRASNPRIVELALEGIAQVGGIQAGSGQMHDPWRVATALERFVHEKMHQGDFTQVFSTASEVAQSLSGDCTEYSVLLAALLRSRGIPARVAFGLVYVPSQQGFLYHMWDEAWIEDRWVPLDATLGLGGIGAGHLKIGDSDLGGDDARTSLLAVLAVVNRLSIEVREEQ